MLYYVSNRQSYFLKKILNLTNSEKITKINVIPKYSLTSNIYVVEIYINFTRKKKLFIKKSHITSHNKYYKQCINEINFYKLIKDTKYEVLPKCYYANIDTFENTTLILEDLSEKYFTLEKQNISANIINMSCSALASLHASFWNCQNINKNLYLYSPLKEKNR